MAKNPLNTASAWFLPALAALFALSGCSDAASGPQAKAKLAKPTFDEVLAIADQEQRTITDGWFFGELPRMFKSKYLLAPISTKAQFAMELHGKLEQLGQNMTANWSSYVPYKTRAQFAQQWWNNPTHSADFSKQEKRYKVLWIHEALMDGSELWWHAFEKKNGQTTPGDMILSHDVEQKMVSDYEDREGQIRSFSDEYTRFTN